MHQTVAGYKKSVPNLQENSTGHLRHGCLFPQEKKQVAAPGQVAVI
jgi:hypothetical protein